MNGVAVTLISTTGAVLVALVGVLVELVKSRKRQDKVVKEVVPNGGSSLRDAIDRIERDTRDVAKTQGHHGERLASLEARLADHLALRRSD
ncbi:hypothetical protein ALI144C_44815 [Actinosynnema sp. ALI-1.44]|uniref:hypothetical protein n=1 Tax=Actinosynnema sp. ALI-1.44 TaxID=1933779 RepID=UPI00097BCF60|nr:hypothetical protein [Actinosynnema sp. ALI-1.44]ONI73077.1 hypothetical protein ALI144C_44815 [Actinosynnema sp. ALI-1.44]